jgi:hypothetical protein
MRSLRSPPTTGGVLAAIFEFGVEGVHVGLGDHICGLYAGVEQRDQVLVPFLEAGLRSGNKCICVVDGTDPTAVLATLGTDLDAARRAREKQLDVMRSSDVYLRSGGFSAQEVISAWKATLSDVMYDGRFEAVRAIETWSRRDVVPDTRELLALESEMNRYLPLYPQVIVCLYDVERFGGGIVVDLLKTHPRVLVGEMLLENPYHMTPDELLAAPGKEATTSVAPEVREVAEWCYAVTTGST